MKPEARVQQRTSHRWREAGKSAAAELWMTREVVEARPAEGEGV
jgi:hypothetical protein